MNTSFYVDLNIKKDNNYEGYGRFYIGNDKAIAYDVFALLKGTDDVDENSILRLDFMEMENSIPVNIRMLNCTLEQVAENCRIITKETFKRFSLGI